MVQDGSDAAGEFSYLLSKAQKPNNVGTTSMSVPPGGQPAVLLPGSAGVSPVPTPVVNPPLPYSLLGAQAGKPQAQACLQHGTLHELAPNHQVSGKIQMQEVCHDRHHHFATCQRGPLV